MAGMNPRYLVYLDTSLLSRMRDGRVKTPDAVAMEGLSEFAGQIRYVSSHQLTNEVAQTYDPKARGVLLLLAALIEKVPWEVPEWSGAVGGSPVGLLGIGASWTHPVYEGLREIFDPPDAHHLFLAVRGGCDFFLTLDRETILNRLSGNEVRIADLCGKTELVDPPQLLRAVTPALKPP
jgi:hypothetical protein